MRRFEDLDQTKTWSVANVGTDRVRHSEHCANMKFVKDNQKRCVLRLFRKRCIIHYSGFRSDLVLHNVIRESYAHKHTTFEDILRFCITPLLIFVRTLDDAAVH